MCGYSYYSDPAWYESSDIKSSASAATLPIWGPGFVVTMFQEHVICEGPWPPVLPQILNFWQSNSYVFTSLPSVDHLPDPYRCPPALLRPNSFLKRRLCPERYFHWPSGLGHRLRWWPPPDHLLLHRPIPEPRLLPMLAFSLLSSFFLWSFPSASTNFNCSANVPSFLCSGDTRCSQRQYFALLARG